MSRLPLSTVFLALACGLLAGGCRDAATENSPLRLVLSEAGASVPTTAVDPSNRTVYFSWFGKDEVDRTTVYVSRLTGHDSVASGAVRVNPPGITANAHAQAPAQVAVAPDGMVYVAWSTHEVIEGRRFPASNLVLARSADGGRTFGSPVFVNDDAGGDPAGHTFHDLTVGSDGTVYVSWLDSRAPETEVRVATSDDQGRTFSPGIVVARGTCQCCRTALAVSDSSVYLAWRHIYGDNIRDIAIARSDDRGRTFSEPVRVRRDGWKIDGCPHSGPALAIDEDGAIHTTWYTAADTTTGLHYAVSRDGGRTFTEERRLESDVPIAQSRLAAGSRGEMWLAWEDPLDHTICTGPADGMRPAMKFGGSAPAIASSETVRSLVWQNHDKIEAYVERPRP